MGKMVNVKVFLTDEDSTRFQAILRYLNNSNEVVSGDMPAWDEQTLYGVLLSDGIEKFKMSRAK